MEDRCLKKWTAAVLLAVALIVTGCLQREGEGPSLQTTPAGPVLSSTNLQAVLTAPDQVSLCDPIPMEFTVTNHRKKTIYLLTWYTPLEGVAGKIFRVTREGQELDYLGILAMRGDPTQDQYVTLEPGGSATAAFDISDYYDFSQPGEYQVVFQSPWISFVTGDPAGLALSVDDLGPVEISSLPVKITVLPSAEDSGSCGREDEAAAIPPETEMGFSVEGIVQDVSPSARIIWLEQEVSGISAIALTGETFLTAEEGSPLQMNEIEPGMAVRALGQPGERGTLIAIEAIITR